MTTRLDLEQALVASGHTVIAGIDEAGRGALAGPVAAGAVILPLDRADQLEKLVDVRDSKKCTALQRDSLYALVCDTAICAAVGMATPAEIDRIGIRPAVHLAMRRALYQLRPFPHALIIDYERLKLVGLPQQSPQKGEDVSLSVAAASILAKVARDRYMIAAAAVDYPDYGFARHKGYATQAHRDAIAQLGPTPIHRHSFAPIRKS
ncbi:MAG: ribonuclease HII [Chloroflexi bacterium]|nr:ribonuclease HII [Chloroflexota bacterium]